MFNNSFKKTEIDNLRKEQDKREKNAEEVSIKSIALYEIRRSSAEILISDVENYINSLANSPKSFDKSISEYKVSYSSFNKIVQELERKSINVDIQAGTGAGASVAAGVGVAAFVPTAAVGIATTFGVASTGTAISALSGAAATNAALAWLGGGALVAGGGGMAAGNALLALAGPLGWAVGGVVLAGTGVYTYKKNKKIGEEAIEERKKVMVYNKSLRTALVEMDELIKLTKQHAKGVSSLLDSLKDVEEQDYESFTQEKKEMAGALINHVNSLSVLLNKKVDG